MINIIKYNCLEDVLEGLVAAIGDSASDNSRTTLSFPCTTLSFHSCYNFKNITLNQNYLKNITSDQNYLKILIWIKIMLFLY